MKNYHNEKLFEYLLSLNYIMFDKNILYKFIHITLCVNIWLGDNKMKKKIVSHPITSFHYNLYTKVCIIYLEYNFV